MTRTVCDICGKEMPTTKYADRIENLNFCMSSHGRIWDICTECRVDLNRWMTMRRAESEDKGMENDKSVKYKNVAIELLKAYLESKEALIVEYSGNSRRSALELKKQALGFLERLDEGEDAFNELVKDMWLFHYYEEESEDTE